MAHRTHPQAGLGQADGSHPIPERSSRVRGVRRLLGAGLVALVGCGATVMAMGTAQAGEGTHSPDRVIVCESGVITHGGGVETSSAVAVRAADGTPVPEGCQEG
jgi:hypothetical protein